MAKVWFCYDGPDPTVGGPVYAVSARDAEGLGLTQSDFMSGLEDQPRPRFNPDSKVGKIGGYQHVVVELSEAEARPLGWSSGYYYLRMAPDEVIERMGREPGSQAQEIVR